MRRTLLKTAAFFLVIVASATLASASTIESANFSLTKDGCTSNCGTSPFGSVDLLQLTPTAVRVTVTLGPNRAFAGTGAGESLGFNIAGNKKVTISNVSSGFAVGPSNYSASSLGNFQFSVHCTVCSGGKLTNPSSLSFIVSFNGGLSITDFIQNNKGYYFASDIRGTNGKTGNVGAILSPTYRMSPPPTGEVPEPWTLTLVGTAIGGMVIARRRRSRQS